MIQDQTIGNRGQSVDVQSAGFELGQVLRILSERRKVIFAAGAIGLVLGILASLLMTPLYRATALIELNSSANDVIETARGRAGQPLNRSATAELVATQIGLMKSMSLARRVAEDLNLVSDPAYGSANSSRSERTNRAAASILGGTTIQAVPGSLLIKVSHVSPDPGKAATIANGVAKSFIATSLERRYDSSSYARSFLNDQLARTKVALEESERNLNNYAIQSGLFRTTGSVVDGKITEGVSLAQADLTALHGALSEARVKRIGAEQAWQNAKVEFTAELTASSSISSMIQRRNELETQYDEKAKLFKPEYPEMRELKAQIDKLNAMIKSERGRVVGNKRSELQGEYLAALNIENQLAEKLNTAKSQVQSERGRSIQYGILQREADTNRALYDALLQRFKEIGVAAGIGQSNVSMVDEADVPRGPYRPSIPVNAGIGLLGGLLAGIGLAFAIHLLLDAIIDPADVRQKLQLPVLGVIPMEPESRTPMEALADRKSDISEAYYSVRTALKFSRPEGAPRTLLVTSTRPGEGKSTSAYAIASSMARLGSKVLLIDADLRKPTFVSSRSDGYGLAHLLGVDESYKAYAETTQIENLTLLPVGRFVGSAAELLSSNRLRAVIAETAKDFDMVVIDGPPVLGLTDAPLLSAAVESTALVIESRQSRTSNAQEMIRRLTESGANLIGVILTKVTAGSNSYGYAYYSYNYGEGDVGGKVSSDPVRALDLNRAT